MEHIALYLPAVRSLKGARSTRVLSNACFSHGIPRSDLGAVRVPPPRRGVASVPPLCVVGCRRAAYHIARTRAILVAYSGRYIYGMIYGLSGLLHMAIRAGSLVSGWRGVSSPAPMRALSRRGRIRLRICIN